jgi:uncharacterized protein (DUF2336 family)
LSQDRSGTAKVAIASKFGQQFDELVQSGQRELALAVLQLLVRDVTREVRVTLAHTVATSTNLPQTTAFALARDDIEIAAPILEKSPVLTDENLIEVVRTNTMQYALAVAGRERLSEALSEALVETGHRPVVATLVSNPGAALSVRTLARVRDDFKNDKEMEARLIRRPELPHEIIDQLVRAIGERLEWELVSTRQIGADEARQLMLAVRERVAIGLTARTHADRQTAQRLREQFDAGRLSHEDLLRCLKEGDIASLELGLSIHSQLDPTTVRRLLYLADRRHMAALCIAANFATPHYIMLRMALDVAEAAVAAGSKGPNYGAETIRYLQIQYERLRRDEGKVGELLRA